MAHDTESEYPAEMTYGYEVLDKMDRLLKFEPDKAVQYYNVLHKRRQRDQTAGKGDFCLAPETKVLTTEFSWMPIGEIRAGDTLVGFDEDVTTVSKDGSQRGQQRTFQKATVESVERKVLPSYCLKTDKQGSIVASSRHFWLVRAQKNQVVWKTTEDLKEGDLIVRFGDIWQDSTSPVQESYLAGLMDGEGHLSKDGRIQFTQKPGLVMDEAARLLDVLGFGYGRTIPTRESKYVLAHQLCVRGGIREAMRFLCQVPTIRLRAQRPDFWVGHQITPKNRYVDEESSVTRVEEVTFVGETEVVAMRTSTGTFLAEGLFSHNSSSNIAYKMLANRGYGDRLRELGVHIF
jgi:hypothetical protein